MFSAREKKRYNHEFKVYDMTLRAPVITTPQSTQHGRQNKKAYWVNNYQWSKHVYM